MKQTVLFILMAALLMPLLPLFSLVPAAEDEPTVTTVTPDASTVTAHGRTYYEADGLHFDWTYAGFSFAFSGTAAQATLATEGAGTVLKVYLDGSTEAVTTLTMRSGSRAYTLVDGLPNGPHTVTVRKSTENRDKSTACVSAISVTGTMAAPPAAPAIQVEVIGDSITAGFGNLDDGKTFNAYRVQGQDGTRTYATLALQHFNVGVSVIARSGIGFAYNNGGSHTNTMLDAYAYTDYFRLGTDVVWDFESHPSDLVIIALGTNDTSAPGPDAYNEGARAFYRLVRAKNPKAVIVWVYEILTASFHDRLVDMVEEARAAGDENVYYYGLGLMDTAAEGVGGAGHPSLATHVRDAKGFTVYLDELMGWQRRAWDGATVSTTQLQPTPESGLRAGDDDRLVLPADYRGKTVADLKAALLNGDAAVAVGDDGRSLADSAFLTDDITVKLRTERTFSDIRRVVFADTADDLLRQDSACLLQDDVLLAPPDPNGTVETLKQQFLHPNTVTVADEKQPELANADPLRTGLLVKAGERALTLAVAGDVNGDGTVNAADALQVLRHAVGKQQLTPVRLVAAAVARQAKLSAVDALMILQYSVGKAHTFPLLAPQQ